MSNPDTTVRMFVVMAERVAAGEPWREVLADYDFCETAAVKDAERAKDAFDEELATRTAQWEEAERERNFLSESLDTRTEQWLSALTKIDAAEAQLTRVREITAEMLTWLDACGFGDGPVMLRARAALAEPAAPNPCPACAAAGFHECHGPHVAEPAAGAPQGGGAQSTKVAPSADNSIANLEPASDAAPSSSASGGGARQWTLCESTGVMAFEGACPAHKGDACLRQYAPVPSVDDDRLRAIAERVRATHLVVDDCWHSCPKSGECCDERRSKTHCTCGADEHNAALDDLLSAIATLQARPTPGGA